MILQIVPIVQAVSKNFETIGMTEAIADFHDMIISIASNTEDAWSSVMFLGPTTEFWRDIRKRNGGHQSQSESPGSLSSFVIVGDHIFLLKTWLMKPYPGKNLDKVSKNL